MLLKTFKSNYRSSAFLLFVLLVLILSSSPITGFAVPASLKPEIPKAREIMKQLIGHNPNHRHPRVIADKTDFDRITQDLKTDPFLQTTFAKVKKEADKTLREAPVKYELSDGVRLLPVSRKVLTRVTNCSLIYRLTGETRYAERAWLELKTISDPRLFADWHPVHYLDTAEMAAAAAIGFDWLYDYLAPEQRKMISTAIEKNVFNTALDIYRSDKGWPKAIHNWNAVCNGGVGVSAIAIGDENSRLRKKAGEIIQSGLRSLPAMMDEFAPDGGWIEGVGYWEYANKYLAYYIATLDKALGTDYGISAFNGYSETGFFPIYMVGSNSTFNFADAGQGRYVKSPALFWLAAKFNKPEYAWYAKTFSSYSALDLIWYRPGHAEQRPTANDRYFQNIQAAVFHSRLNTADDLFLGFKAGDNQANHGDLDIGTFVIDALGERWAEELGSDNYNLPKYFSRTDPKGRWQYYRKRAEGQNTIVINPSAEPDQDIRAKAKIVQFKSEPGGGFAVADLTPVYTKEALSIQRGAGIFDHRSRIILRDELSLRKPSELWWFMHTKADIVLKNNGKQALLTINHKQMLFTLVTPGNAAFTIMDAVPLPTSPNPPGQAHQQKNPYRKLAVHLSGVTETAITVIGEPLSPAYLPQVNYSVIPIAEWEKRLLKVTHNL